MTASERLAWLQAAGVGEATVGVGHVSFRFNVAPPPADACSDLHRASSAAYGVELPVARASCLAGKDLGHVIAEANDLGSVGVLLGGNEHQSQQAGSGLELVDGSGVVPRADNEPAPAVWRDDGVGDWRN